MLKVVYIVHGKDKADCYRIRKEKGLPEDQCVNVLKGFETETQKDSEYIKHIYG